MSLNVTSQQHVVCLSLAARDATALVGFGRRDLGLRRRLRRRDGHAEQSPLPAHVLEQQIEADLQRSCRKTPLQAQPFLGVKDRCGGELGGRQRGRKEIETPPAQIGEALREIGGSVVRLEIRRREIAQHRVVARTIGVVEGQKRGADEVERLIEADGQGGRLVGGGGSFRLGRGGGRCWLRPGIRL